MYEKRTMRPLLRKLIPGTHEIRRHAFLRRVFGRLLFAPDLWHLGRSSVARAVSIGLFMAWVPVPFQMVLAAGAALVARCNLPVAIAMVWVSNPVTVAPLFYAAHKLGEWMLDRPPGDFRIELSLRWLFEELGNVWEPLLLGCFVMGIASALGASVIRRRGMTANVDTDLSLKFDCAVEALEEHDLVMVHVKGADIAAAGCRPGRAQLVSFEAEMGFRVINCRAAVMQRMVCGRAG